MGVRKQYHQRATSASSRLHRIIYGEQLMPNYIEAVKSHYEINSIPSNYVLQKHANLIKYVRNQELLDTYIRLVEQHNEKLIKWKVNMEKMFNANSNGGHGVVSIYLSE